MTTELRVKQQKPRPAVFPRNIPDPRPVTDYTVTLSSVGPNSRVTITLAQPCVIRTPAWGFINCDTGASTAASSVTVVSNTSFYFDFSGTLNPAIGFVDVPYQDPQVQNFQGGYVRPGARWFRAPVGP